jgi:hypothetical protein
LIEKILIFAIMFYYLVFNVKVLLIKILDLIWLNMLRYNLTSNVAIRNKRINEIYYKLNYSKTKNTVIIERHKRYLIFIY